MAYGLIKKHVKWNGKHRVYASSTLRAAFNKNEGNTAEVNLLLVNLLRSVGIQAQPSFNQYTGSWKINQFYPRFAAFNSVIVLARLKLKTY